MDFERFITLMKKYVTRWRVTWGYLFALFYLFLVRPASLFFLVLGIEIAFLGLLLRFWASGYLHKAKELCTSGPYAYVRHPLYLGSFLLGFGFCLAGSSFEYWLRSSIIWLIFLSGFGLIYSFQILAEEKELEKIFCEEYQRYSRSVPPFFPCLTKFNGEKVSFFDFKLFRKNKEYLALIGFLLIILFLSGRYAFGEEKVFSLTEGSSSPRFIWRKLENQSFQVGESLLFILKWGIIPGGWATLEIPEKIVINGRQAYRIISHTRTNSFFDLFYKVRDYNESWMDIESLCSLGYEKHLKEGRYTNDEKVIFDQEKGFALVGGKNEKIVISPYVQDVLSGLYFMRTQNFTLGETYFLEVNNNGKNWQLEVKISNREEVKVPAGKFSCWLIEPFLKYEGIFQHRGRILIWLTADEKKMPVLMRTKIPIGSIDAELIEIKS